MAGLDKYFSVLALPILSREAIKVSFFCGMQHQYLSRAKPGLKRAGESGVHANLRLVSRLSGLRAVQRKDSTKMAASWCIVFTCTCNLVDGLTSRCLAPVTTGFRLHPTYLRQQA